MSKALEVSHFISFVIQVTWELLVKDSMNFTGPVALAAVRQSRASPERHGRAEKGNDHVPQVSTSGTIQLPEKR